MNANILSFLIGIFIIILSEIRPFNPYAFSLAFVPQIICQRYATGMVIMNNATLEYLTYWLVCSYLVWALRRKRGRLDKGTESMVCVLTVLVGEMVWMIWELLAMQTENILDLREAEFQIFRSLIDEVIPLQIVFCIVINLIVSYVKDYFIEYWIKKNI